VYRPGILLANGRTAKEVGMDVLARISPMLDRSAGLLLSSQTCFLAKGLMSAQYSLFLAADHCDFIPFDHMDQASKSCLVVLAAQ